MTVPSDTAQAAGSAAPPYGALQEDGIFLEGDEEVQYVLVDLPANQAAELMKPGTTLHFHDLESDSPFLKDSTGQVVCQGRYAEEIGTVMVLQDANSVHAADASEQHAAGSSGQAAAGSAPQLQYQCHTEQRLRMWAPEQAPEATQREMSPSNVTPTAVAPTGVGG